MRVEKAVRLREFIAEHKNNPFQWGQWDCVLFASRCADFITGKNNSAQWCGSYDSELGAKKMVAKYFGGDFSSVFDAYYNTIHPDYAEQGDIVLVEQEKPTCGVLDRDIVLFAGDKSLCFEYRQYTKLIKAWRVE